MKRLRSDRRIVNVLAPSNRVDVGANSTRQRPYQIGQGLVFVSRLYEEMDAAGERGAVISCRATELACVLNAGETRRAEIHVLVPTLPSIRISNDCATRRPIHQLESKTL